MTSDNAKKAIDLVAEWAQTGILCISTEEQKILKDYFCTVCNIPRE